ncbi:MAG: preprotein translocase subunit SecE [Anaerolineales bacterium]|nr:preprotein translocase subunit SecE [Anaerolineales bacterium]
MAKSKVGSRKRSNFIVRFFRETVAELRKVNWPSRQDATQLTVIVLIVIVFMSTLLAVMDYLFSRFFGFIITLG